MNPFEGPPDIRKWLLGATVADVRSVLAGYMYDGASLDNKDVADIRRKVVCDSVILGLSAPSHMLFGMANCASRKSVKEIPGYFVGVMERCLDTREPPLSLLPRPVLIAAHMACELDKQVAKEIFSTMLAVTILDSVNMSPDFSSIDDDDE